MTQSTEKGIFVYASSPFSPATKAAIEKLSAESQPDGQVKWIVTPDGEHGMYIQDWKKAFPEAKWVALFFPQISKKPLTNGVGLSGSRGIKTKSQGCSGLVCSEQEATSRSTALSQR